MNKQRYAVNHYLCPADIPFRTFAEEVAKAGFDSIGITEAAVQEMGVASLSSLLADMGLGVSSLNTAGFFLSDDPRQDRRNAALLEAAVNLNADALNIIVGAAHESIPLHEARALAQHGLAGMATQAHAAGVQLVVEPMWIANVYSKSCFNSIAQIENVFAAIPGLKMNLDYYHLWADPDIGRVIRGNSVEAGLIQLCDISWQTLPSQALRAPLGEGRLSVLTELETLGWQPGGCTLELELFIDQLPGRDYAQLIREAASCLGLH